MSRIMRRFARSGASAATEVVGAVAFAAAVVAVLDTTATSTRLAMAVPGVVVTAAHRDRARPEIVSRNAGVGYGLALGT